MNRDTNYIWYLRCFRHMPSNYYDQQNLKDSEIHFSQNGKGQVEFGTVSEGENKYKEERADGKNTTIRRNTEKYKTHPKNDKWIYLRNHCGGQGTWGSRGQLCLEGVCQYVLYNM